MSKRNRSADDWQEVQTDPSEASLNVGIDEVEPICEDLKLSEDVVVQAKGYTRRAAFEHPINRKPLVLAAGAVYLASLVENEKRSQAAVAETVGVTEVSLREAYLDIARFEGLRTVDHDDDDTWARISEIIQTLRSRGWAV